MQPLSLKFTDLSLRYWLGTVFCLLVFLSSGRVTTIDVGTRAEMSRSLWKKGSVFFPTTAIMEGNMAHPQGKTEGTSFYGVGQSLVFIPFDMISALIEKVFGAKEGLEHIFRYAALIFLYAPLLGTLSWWLLSEILIQYGLRASRSRVLSFLGLFSTIWLPYNTQILQEEALVGTVLLGALLLLLYWKKTGSPLFFQCGTLILFTTLLVRLNSIFGIMLCLAFVSDALLRKKVWEKAYLQRLTLSLLPVLIICALFSYARFGKFFSNGYDLAMKGGTQSLMGPIRLDLAWGLLFGWGKGLFLFSPVLLLFFVWVKRYGRSELLCVSLAVFSLLASVIFHSKMRGVAFPDGSESWGTRFQVHMVFLLLVPVCRMLALFGSGIKKYLCYCLVGLGFLIQLASISAPESLEYCIQTTTQTSREAFLMEWGSGQLFQRLTSIARRSGFALAPATHCPDELKNKMETYYMPNLWGPVYAKRVGSHGLKALILFSWWSLLAITILLGIAAVRSAQKDRRVNLNPAEDDLGMLPLFRNF